MISYWDMLLGCAEHRCYEGIHDAIYCAAVHILKRHFDQVAVYIAQGLP